MLRKIALSCAAQHWILAMLISENSGSIDLNTAVANAGGHLAAFGQLCHTNWLEAW